MTDDETLRRRHLAAFRALMPQHLARSTWSPERVRAERERGLRRLIASAKQSSRWHRDRLAGIDPDRVTEADLPRIPTMTKAEMMAHLDDAFTDPRLSGELVQEHVRTRTGEAYLLDEYHVFLSSGSSGERGLFVWTGTDGCRTVWCSRDAGCASERRSVLPRMPSRRWSPRRAHTLLPHRPCGLGPCRSCCCRRRRRSANWSTR